MQCDRISEAAFLLVELRYTLAQLRAQLTGLDDSASADSLQDGETVNSILEAMARSETRFQAHYAGLLHVSLPERVPEERIRGVDGFERIRRQTIDMLDRVGDDWPESLLDSVKQHVADDREYATQIAEHGRRLPHDD